MNLRFGPFEFDPRTGELWRSGAPADLQPQPAQVLAVLVARPGELVLREEIREAVWPDRIVEFDQGLNFCIRQIRAALGDDAGSPSYVETFPRRGYRFIAPVERVDEDPKVVASRGSVASRDRRTVGIRAAVVLVPLLLVAGAFLARDADQEPAAGEDGRAAGAARVRLAVLPFENLSGDPALDPLGDGLTEELIQALVAVDPDRLGVIARTSSMRYRDADQPIERIGEELGVDYVLEGSVRGGERGIRVTAQLVRVSDRTHVWAESYDRPFGRGLAIESDVARRVVGTLAPGIALDLDRRQGVAPADSALRRIHLDARWLLNRADSASVTRALGLFERVIAREPGFAPAYLGAGEAFLRLKRPAEAMAPLREALELDESNPEAHHHLANAILLVDWDWPAVGRHAERALGLAPGRAESHSLYAYYQAAIGRMDEAVGEIGTALALDPVSPNVNSDAGWIYFWANRYDDAIVQCERALSLGLPHPYGRRCVLFSLIEADRADEARVVARAILADEGATSEEIGAVTRGGEDTQLRAFWEWEAARLEGLLARPLTPGSYRDVQFPLARVYVQLGRTEDAFAALERAYQARSPWMPYLAVDPQMAALRGDPRFADLVRRVRGG